MDSRIKELIAIGASVTANCHPCLKYHVDKAKELGVDEQDLMVAIAVAKMVRKSVSSKTDRLVSALLTDAEKVELPFADEEIDDLKVKGKDKTLSVYQVKTSNS